MKCDLSRHISSTSTILMKIYTFFPLYKNTPRGFGVLGFLDKDLDHIGEEAIGFYGFSSFLDRGMTCILGFPFPD